MLIDDGDTHRLTVTGAPGDAVRLLGNGRGLRAATTFVSGQITWTLQPRDRTLSYAEVDDQQIVSATVEVRRTVTIGASEADGI